MSRRLLLTVLTAFLLVVGTAPALADEPAGDGNAASDAKWALLEAEFDGVWTAELEDDLREVELGWGDVFKILVMLTVEEYDSLEELIDDLCDETTGECDFAWGEFKLSQDGIEAFEALAKNFGQLVSAAMRGHGRPDHAVGPDGTPPGKDKAPGPPARPSKP